MIDRPIPRRRLLAALAVAGNATLSGCLSFGPSIETNGLANSQVFGRIEPAGTFAFTNKFTASVYLKPAAYDELDVYELEVLAERVRPYSVTSAALPPGSVRTRKNISVQPPVDQTVTISAVTAEGAPVESVRITTGGNVWFTDIQEETSTRAETTRMPAEILTTDFEKHRTAFSTNAIMNGKIKNTSTDKEIVHLAAEAAFTNAAGRVIDRSVSSLGGLSPGEVWDVVVPYLGDAGAATGGELTVSESLVGQEPIPPTNVTLLEDRLERPESVVNPPQVVGELRNIASSRLPFLEAEATFYARNGDILGDEAATVTGLPPGETWEFEIPFYAHSQQRAQRVASYKLSLVA